MLGSDTFVVMQAWSSCLDPCGHGNVDACRNVGTTPPAQPTLNSPFPFEAHSPDVGKQLAASS